MRHNPANPDWVGRDRFVLSAGHSSITLYTQLYLAGFGLELDDLQVAAHLGQQDPRPPRARPHRRRRDHHRPARPGRRQRGRHGDGRPPRARPVRPRGRPGREPVRPPDLRDLQRRRPRGGRQLRGLLARRHPAARQPDADLRRQRHLDRGRHRHRLHRGRRRALRGLRLGRAPHRLDQRRHAATRRTSRSCGTPSRRPARVTDRPSFIALKTVIAWPAPNAQGTGKSHGSALGDGRGRGHQEDPRLRPRARPSRSPPRSSSTPAAARRARHGGRGGVAGGRSTPGPRRTGERKELFDRMRTRTLPAGWEEALPSLPRRREGRRHPQGLRRGALRDRAGAARAVGRLRRPRRVQQHHPQGRSRPSSPPSCPPRTSPATSYGRVLHFGIREHGMGSVMNGIALHGGTRVYGGTFLDVLRLHARRGPARRR